MASRFLRPKPRVNAASFALAAAFVAFLLSAGLFILTIDDWRVDVAFAAMLAGGAALALLTGFGRRGGGEAMPDRALLFSLASAAPDAVALSDRDGLILTANIAHSALFGTVRTVFADDQLAQIAALALRDGSGRLEGYEIAGRRFVVTVERCGGSDCWLLWRFVELEAEVAGPLEGFTSGTGGDLLGQMGVALALLDAEGRVRAHNAHMAGIASIQIGMPVDELIGIDPDGTARLAGRGEGGEGEPYRPALLPTGGGGLLLMLATGTPRPHDAAAPIRFYELLRMLPLGLAMVDRDGRMQFMNPAFRRAAGIVGADTPVFPSELVIPEDAAPLSEAVRRAASGHARSLDLAVRLGPRPDEPVALSVSPVRGIAGAAVLLSLKDNEEETRLRRQVAQATKMQAVGQLAGGVAHDFNNILTGILGHCDLMLMRHAPGDSDYDDIQQVKHNANRAAGLTRQLLAFSRQQTLRPQLLQLPDVISEISNLLKRLLGETVTLEVRHGRDLGTVRADPGQLEQVIVNLAVNARDAMPEGGRLTLTTFAVSTEEAQAIENDILPAADYTALSVSDSGTGIPPEILPKIFEPFFTTKDVGKGTGLGLSTVYGIVKQTGGYIFADSTPGKGTTFTIYLPVHRGAVLPEAQLAGEAGGRARGHEPWGSGTILLVEDEAMVRAVAERALSRQGYDVLTATNGEEALELLDRARAGGGGVDLLLSDVVMPLMDGPLLARRARAHYPRLPVLFMSGYAEEQLRNSIDLDNVAFLPKPFSVQQLGEAVRAALADNGEAKAAGEDAA